MYSYKQLAIVGMTFICFNLIFIKTIFGQGFTDVTISSGTVFLHDGDPVFDFKIGTGAAWLDYDKDGDLDLYVTQRQSANRLFENDGNGNFTDVASSLGVTDASGDGGGVTIVDFNNDGWDDIFLSNNQGNKLLKSNSGLSFTDITNTAFVGGTAGGNSRSPSASWGDYDNDGYLDLYIAQHSPPSYNQSQGTTQDFFFHNNGNETFTDISNLLVLDSLTSWGFIGGWTDYDKDGDMDIFLVNDCLDTPYGLYTKIFRNDGGTDPLNWNFTEVAASVGVDACKNGMGIAVGDYNRDGWMDIFHTNIGSCLLYENNNGTFVDKSSAAQIDIQPATHFSWGCGFFDYDLDGWQDIMVAIGTLNISSLDPQPNMLFHNNGDGTFTNMAGSLGMDDDRRSRSGIYGDYDNDGDLDIYLTNYGENCILHRNDNNNGNNWFKVHLQGTQSNQDGLGSKIKITTPDGGVQYYETKSGSNLGGGDTPYAHFGLGNNNTITELEIKWLSGEIQVFNNISVNQLLNVTEPNNNPLPVELINFTAQQKNKSVQLNWSTASEINNKHFILERSNDGHRFSFLGKINGGGTTAEISHYEFVDTHPLQGRNYYRLKQVDTNDKFHYSQVEQVLFLGNETTLNIFPNPSNTGLLNLNFYNQQVGTQIEIRDMLGRLIYQNKIENIGQQLLEINTDNWTNGIFMVSVFNSNLDINAKVMIDN